MRGEKVDMKETTEEETMKTMETTLPLLTTQMKISGYKSGDALQWLGKDVTPVFGSRCLWIA